MPCYVINYSREAAAAIFAKDGNDPAEFDAIREYRCLKTCNQYKGCKKHKCQIPCCPVKKGGPDPEGDHLCLMECPKTLSCGVHKCADFCHFGPCKPCKVYSREPLYCPCGVAKLDPPIRCGQV